MAVIWAFRCYVDARKTELMENWYRQRTVEARAIFLSRLRFLAATPRHQWVRPYFDLLSAECAGLGEIRFKANRTQYRPLGFFSPGQVFTFVNCAVEKDGSFVPKSACSIGLNRKKEIESNSERCHVCKFRLE